MLTHKQLEYIIERALEIRHWAQQAIDETDTYDSLIGMIGDCVDEIDTLISEA